MSVLQAPTRPHVRIALDHRAQHRLLVRRRSRKAPHLQRIGDLPEAVEVRNLRNGRYTASMPRALNPRLWISGDRECITGLPMTPKIAVERPMDLNRYTSSRLTGVTCPGATARAVGDA